MEWFPSFYNLFNKMFIIILHFSRSSSLKIITIIITIAHHPRLKFVKCTVGRRRKCCRRRKSSRRRFAVIKWSQIILPSSFAVAVVMMRRRCRRRRGN
jgi:hypothetical protein